MSETQVVSSHDLQNVVKESREILAGYTLERRIGSGGFGEVWQATGPGGLEKAVKILYGQLEDRQAETELKSLERVRKLHHPFLLNIERIEVADGRLIIVTELAERSLEDRYAECRKQEWQGIPFEELLNYLRDAADALDYMSSQHGLQHLDVKPDNLLLQGGHVKVADFGLTKDLSQSQVSLVGAFTPLYAPPELYEGQAAQSSDQYSLAVVYQTMLTGIPPFVGRTAAQLAAQHLSSQPNLQSLPISDRPTVARALSKNPDARFGSCREFLDDLLSRRQDREQPKVRPGSKGLPIRTPQGNDPIDVSGGATKLVEEYPESQPIKSLRLMETPLSYRPTLFVGLGGFGGHVVRNLKHRITVRFGTESTLPGLGYLYLDTNGQEIKQALREPRQPLSLGETLAIPLKSPQEYKTAEVDFSSWLSRRWLYNIPRSRQVEGMRALGRLAFADHQNAIRMRIREHVNRLVTPESLAEMNSLTGLNFEGSPQVVILASLMGGTGSGAVMDLGYLIQEELSALGFIGDIDGVLMFGTDSRDGDRDLAIANSLACLHELNHFSQSGFVGDPSCQLQEATTLPFDNTYIIHFGDRLNDGGFAQGLSSVTEYLYRRTCTSARRFFLALREQTRTKNLSQGSLHTFAVRSVEAKSLQEGNIQARRLTTRQIASWIRPLSVAEEELVTKEMAQIGEEQLKHLGWKLTGLLDLALLKLKAKEEEREPARILDWLSGHTGSLGESQPAGSEKTRVDLMRIVDQAFEPSDTQQPTSPRQTLADFQAELQQQATQGMANFREFVAAELDRWRHPIESARSLIQWIGTNLETSRNHLTLVIQQLAQELMGFSPTPLTDASGMVKAIRQNEFVAHYADLRLCYELHCSLLSHINSLRTVLLDELSSVQVVQNRLNDLLTNMRLRMEEPISFDDTPAEEDFRGDLNQRNQYPLRRFWQTPVNEEAQWLEWIEQQAKHFLLSFPQPPTETEFSPQSPLISDSDLVTCHLQKVGGVHAAILVTPHQDSSCIGIPKEQFQEESVSHIVDPDQPAYLCLETRNLSSEAVAQAVIEYREDLKDVASRLHTRIDINW